MKIGTNSCPAPPDNGLIAGFTTAYDASSNKLYERLLASEGRSSLYPDHDSIDRLLKVERGVIEEPAQGEDPAAIEVSIMVEGLKESITYDLDGVGNWLQTESVVVEEDGETSEVTQTNTPNNLNQYEGLSYDKNGNLLSDSKYDYLYDVFNRLRQVKRKSDGKMIAEYFYDAMGRRVSKRVPQYDTEAQELEDMEPVSFAAETRSVYDSLSRELTEYQGTYTPNGKRNISIQRIVRQVQQVRFESVVPTEAVYPSGRQVYTGYDQLYRMVSIAEAQQEDDGQEASFEVKRLRSNGGQETIPATPIGLWEFFGPSRTARMQQGEHLLATYMNDAADRSAVQSADEVAEWGDAETDRLGYDGAGRPITKRYFDAKEPPLAVLIEGSDLIESHHNRWQYYVRLVAFDIESGQWVRADDSEDPLIAYNTAEANNTEFGVQGSGDNIPSLINEDDEEVPDLPEGYAMQPIGKQAVIQNARIKINCEGLREVYFTAPNNISQDPQ
ncbi:MAG: hypothetical protein AAF711_11720 [Planctomycetota bacterium]